MKTVLITGATQGLGAALASAYVERAERVVGIDYRWPSRVAGLHSAVTADLSKTEDRLSMLGELKAFAPFDIVIHNAGISATGPFETLDPTLQDAVIETNLVAPFFLTAALLKNDLVDPSASFVFIGSLSTFVGYPGASAYAASKDGLSAFAGSLRAAPAMRGRHVLMVYPGPLRTEHARRHAPVGASEERRMSPEKAASLIVAAVDARRRTLVPGVANKLAAMIGGLVPNLATRVMRKALFEPLRNSPPLSSPMEGEA